MSIAPKLQLILDTKAGLKSYLGIPNGVPFSQYVKWINWKGATPPADLLFADYTKDRYSVSGVPDGFNDVNEFTRLTAAANFVDGKLVEYAANKPRIEAGKGILVEPTFTNIFTDNTSYTNITTVSGISKQVISDQSFPSALKLTASLTVNVFGMAKTPNRSGDPSELLRTIYVKKGEARYFAFGSYGVMYNSILLDTETGVESYFLNNTGGFRLIEDCGNYWKVVIKTEFSSAIGSVHGGFIFGFGSSIVDNKPVAVSGDACTVAYPLWAATELTYSTDIKTSGAATTRAPDLNRITVPPGKTLTLDADAGVSFIMENATTALITATKPAYIRSARVN